MTSACPSPVELTRELSIGASENLSAHLARCESCAAEWASIEQVTALAHELPAPDLSDQRADSVRNALLSAAASTTAPVRIRAAGPLLFATAAAAAVALLIGGYLLVRAPVAPTSEPEPTAEVFRATLHPHAGSQHAVVGAQPDEIVRLTEGTVTFEVTPLEEGERFRVVTADAEVEVSGTVFDVTAAGDSLVAVQVISGEVIVRPPEGPEVVLAAGERWPRPERGGSGGDTPAEQAQIAEPAAPTAAIRTAAAPRPRPVASQVRARARNVERLVVSASETSTPEAPAPQSERAAQPEQAEQAATAPAQAAPAAPTNNAQLAFERGWNALRAGDTSSAAAAFSVAAQSADPIAEDAGFWSAVAHARAGRNAQAAAALTRFLKRYPGSPRAGEASAMLGWKLLRAGQVQQAEARFRAAVNDPVARVRASAVKGLQAVEERLSKSPNDFK
jgi:TolA-binding protein